MPTRGTDASVIHAGKCEMQNTSGKVASVRFAQRPAMRVTTGQRTAKNVQGAELSAKMPTHGADASVIYVADCETKPISGNNANAQCAMRNNTNGKKTSAVFVEP